MLLTLGVALESQSWLALLYPTYRLEPLGVALSASTVALHLLAKTHFNSALTKPSRSMQFNITLNHGRTRLELLCVLSSSLRKHVFTESVAVIIATDLSSRPIRSASVFTNAISVISSSPTVCHLWCPSGLFAPTLISHLHRYGQCVSTHDVLFIVVGSW